MNQSDFIESLALKTGANKATTSKFLDAFFETVNENLKEGVRFVGFGTFAATERKARTGHHPQTGEKITIAPKWVPVFKAGSGLKNAAQKCAE